MATPDLLAGTDGTPFFHGVRDVFCETWHTDRVVLMDDAAHAIHPISGMRASFALQDARILAQELATARPVDVSSALERYESRRRSDVTSVKRNAQFEAAVTLLEFDLLRAVRDSLVRETPVFEWFFARQETR